MPREIRISGSLGFVTKAGKGQIGYPGSISILSVAFGENGLT
jgi:hypothetical protein